MYHNCNELILYKFIIKTYRDALTKVYIIKLHDEIEATSKLYNKYLNNINESALRYHSIFSTTLNF